MRAGGTLNRGQVVEITTLSGCERWESVFTA